MKSRVCVSQDICGLRQSAARVAVFRQALPQSQPSTFKTQPFDLPRYMVAKNVFKTQTELHLIVQTSNFGGFKTIVECCSLCMPYQAR